MKGALITPTEYLKDVQPYSNYHLVLVHKVIYDAKYQQFYAERSKVGDYIILDNSAVERGGKAVPMKEIVLAAILIKPAIVILPDIMFDSRKTLDQLESALRSPHAQFLRKVLPNTRIGAVVQGVDERDWLECFSILNDTENGISLLGVPMLTTQLFGSRVECLRRIAKRVKKPCHLLGVWKGTPLNELAAEASFPFVMGVDTSKPVRLSLMDKSLNEWDKVEHDPGYLARNYNGINRELLRDNCTRFLSLCKGE